MPQKMHLNGGNIMQNAKPKKYTPFKGAPAPKYVQNAFKGASKPKDHNSGFKK